MANTSRILRFTAEEGAHEVTDSLAEEEPLEIRVGQRAVSVTLRTPGHDAELVTGFLLTEGIIQRPADVLRIEPCAHDRGGNIANVVLAPNVAVDFGRLTRHVFMSSSCGLCGKAAIEAIHQQLEPLQNTVQIDAQALLSMPDQLRLAQPTFDLTGGLHAAGLFTCSGQLLAAREDVGRHNAVDKVIGFAAINDLLPLSQHVLMVSGRSSFEIMQKALSAGVPVVAAVSAPSSLAVEFARESNQTLVGFLRMGRMNIYSHPQRIQFTQAKAR